MRVRVRHTLLRQRPRQQTEPGLGAARAAHACARAWACLYVCLRTGMQDVHTHIKVARARGYVDMQLQSRSSSLATPLK